MRVKIVSAKELTTDNPKLCMSPLRVFGLCHKCQIFKSARGTPELKLKKLPCKPKVQPKYLELLKEKHELLLKLREIDRLLNL